MAARKESLAASLAVLRDLQADGRRVFRSNELTRVHRERLLKSGFLQEVMKGWLISSSPSVEPGETTPWYASFWEFCARYCEARFGTQWHLSPEQSILLHGESSLIPLQTVICSPTGTNNKIDLPFGSSLYDLKEVKSPFASELTIRDGLRLFTPAAALIRVSESFLARHPTEAAVVLSSAGDGTDVLHSLLTGGHSVVAGRLTAAFRRVGRPAVAERIASTMKAAGYVLREADPFPARGAVARLPDGAPPIVGRLHAMWESMRDAVIETMPEPPGLPRARKLYLRAVDEIYRSDAYHSLSIEGYLVSPALIDRVRSGAWNPALNAADRDSRDALAARGYWNAFRLVEQDVSSILGKANPGLLTRERHRDWYRALFEPCVSAGLIPPSALAGYRNDAVYLRTSRYVPPRWEAVRDAMPALFDLLATEPHAAVRAVLGHWLLGYIHPYPDGNGRIARFLMNVMLASGGYPWTVIKVDDREAYLKALDSASIDQNIRPFAKFIGVRVRRAMA